MHNIILWLQYLTPSEKSVAKSSTWSPASLRFTLAQFLKVLAWIWIHSSSRPRICIDLAACPSGDLAASPARSASEIRRLSATVILTVNYTNYRLLYHCCKGMICESLVTLELSKVFTEIYMFHAWLDICV